MFSYGPPPMSLLESHQPGTGLFGSGGAGDDSTYYSGREPDINFPKLTLTSCAFPGLVNII
jgi:hypothetical protein